MGNGNNPCRMSFCSKVEMCMQEEGLTGLYRILRKHEISRCTYRCWHLSLPFPVFPCKAPPSHRHTHMPAPALMHFYCPHPLFLLSSSTRYHYITVFLHCSATCLASPSLICPACLYFIPLRLSLSLSLSLSAPNSVFFLPASSFSLWQGSSPWYIYRPLNFSISTGKWFQGFPLLI